jgi:mannose-1-phosphate guanylyltransferase
VRAVVLVGGFGTRLRPLTLSTPKQMLPVGGRPMIERVFAHLAAHGVDDAVLSLGYKADAFTSAYPDDVCSGVHLSYAEEPEPLDTAGAVRFAARHAGIDDTFVVVNADVLSDLDLGALIEFHRARGAEGSIALTPVDDPSHFGVVPTDADGRVEAFIEKPPRDSAPTNLINAGFYVLEPSVIDRIADDRKVSIERETFPAMVADRSLFALADSSYWLDVGTNERYLQASLDVLDGVRAEDPFPPPVASATVDGALEGPTILGEHVVVEPGAVVRRSVLGAGCRVASGAIVEDAVLLGGVHVGIGATVRRSVIAAAAVIGDEAVVDDLTVIGDGVHVDARAHLAGALVPDPAASS